MRTWGTKRHQKCNLSLVYLELEGVNIHRCGFLLRKPGTLRHFQTHFKRKELVKAVWISLMRGALIQDEGDVSSLSSKVKVTEDLAGQAVSELHFCVYVMILQHISFVFQEKMWLTDGTVK